MSERAFGELEALCYMVARGGKPAANIALQDRYLAGARTLIERQYGAWYLKTSVERF